ncbi:hypothetical protein ASPU41_15185 [Arthrobacter sp. U41]|nr:hypothetical protein ASPU41_15185 [Arthrobacter sp. U41]
MGLGDGRHNGLDVDYALEGVPPACHQGRTGAGHEHGVQRIVERRPAAHHGQLRIRDRADRLQAPELAARKPLQGPLAGIDDDGVAVAGRRDALKDVSCGLTGPARDRFGKRRVPDPGQRQLFEPRARADEVLDKLVGRVPEDPFRRVVLDQPGALVKDCDPVTEFDRLVDVMRHADNRFLQVGLDLQQFVLQQLPGDRVHRAERFVHQEHGRVGGERAGHSDALLLASRELLGKTVAVDPRIERHQLQQLVDAGGNPLLVPAQHLRHDGDVCRHRHMGEKAPGLDDVADFPPELVAVLFRDVLTVKNDPSVGGLDEPVDHFQRGGFPAAGRANEHHHFPRRNFQGQAVHRGPGLARVALGDLVQQDAGPCDSFGVPQLFESGCWDRFRHGYLAELPAGRGRPEGDQG